MELVVKQVFNTISDAGFSSHVPVVVTTIQAGFPSPAADYIEERIDLNDLLIKTPSATFFVKVEGESMTGAFIPPKALLVVDRSLTAVSGDIIVAVINGEFTVKRLLKVGDDLYLIPENKKYQKIKIDQEMEFQVWGIVSHIIINTKDI
jgi:DNA polymerase V